MRMGISGDHQLAEEALIPTGPSPQVEGWLALSNSGQGRLTKMVRDARARPNKTERFGDGNFTAPPAPHHSSATSEGVGGVRDALTASYITREFPRRKGFGVKAQLFDTVLKG